MANLQGRIRRDGGRGAAWRLAIGRRRGANVSQRHRHMGRIAFPLPPAVLHLANALANMARPLGIRAQAAGRIRVPQGFLHAQDDGLDREKPFLNANSFAEGIAALLGRGNHQPKQGRPVHRAAAREVARVRIQQAQFIGGDQDEARLIEATPAGAPAEFAVQLKREFVAD